MQETGGAGHPETSEESPAKWFCMKAPLHLGLALKMKVAYSADDLRKRCKGDALKLAALEAFLLDPAKLEEVPAPNEQANTVGAGSKQSKEPKEKPVKEKASKPPKKKAAQKDDHHLPDENSNMTEKDDEAKKEIEEQREEKASAKEEASREQRGEKATEREEASRDSGAKQKGKPIESKEKKEEGTDNDNKPSKESHNKRPKESLTERSQTSAGEQPQERDSKRPKASDSQRPQDSLPRLPLVDDSEPKDLIVGQIVFHLLARPHRPARIVEITDALDAPYRIRYLDAESEARGPLGEICVSFSNLEAFKESDVPKIHDLIASSTPAPPPPDQQ